MGWKQSTEARRECSPFRFFGSSDFLGGAGDGAAHSRPLARHFLELPLDPRQTAEVGSIPGHVACSLHSRE
jgi:hypothetical protein